jgi:hypothetical protein
MSAKKNVITTPLHLLQNLSHSLLEHLETACAGALIDAEKLLAKLEKQRGKGQDLLHTARVKLQDAAVAGKAKSQAKSKVLIADLEALLDGLQERQAETRAYIAELKRDAQESLKLAQGIGKVKEAVTKVLSARSNQAAVVAAKPVVKAPAKPATKPASKAATPAAKSTVAKPAVAKVPAKPLAKASAAAKPAVKAPVKAVAKPAASKPAAKPVAKSVAKLVAKPVSKAAAKPAAKAPASKPAVTAAAPAPAPAAGNGAGAPAGTVG